MAKRTIILVWLQAWTLLSFGRADSLPSTLHKDRVWILAGANALLWTGTYMALDHAWYSGYSRTGFHFFDDLPEWNQMDKAGHIWSTYQVSRATTEMWEWAGLQRKKAAVVGAALGMVYQGIIELQDAYSEEWGFSWSDIASNAVGAGGFLAQELAWHEQRIHVKFSYWSEQYPAELRSRRDQLFGSAATERILKDYNAQIYWLSGNLAAFLPESGLPRWLNVSVGYGAGGMYGGRTNRWADANDVWHDYSQVKRARRYYLSLDADLTRIPTNSKLLRTVFFVLNAVKVPAPAIEFNNNGRFLFHLLK